MTKRKHISFPAFFLMWAEMNGWDVPDFHIEICYWLENRGRRAVLRVFRGAAKSTIFALYQAWRLREDPSTRFIDRGSEDDSAIKLSSDTKNVLMKHPLCKGMTKGKLGVEKFSVAGNPDARNASVTAYGILSNATGSRADEICNDDTEVPKNIKTPDARTTLRQRLGEETHIIVPGGKILYIGTPHTHDSIYDERIKDGYEELTIPLFKMNARHEGDGSRKEFGFDFKAEPDDFYVMIGREVLGAHEYKITEGSVILKAPPVEGAVVDLYAGNVWSRRFTREEIAFRRHECKTQNEWDSQYLLKARPIHEIRLNPEHMVVYDAQPEIRQANGVVAMSIDNRVIVNSRACWDCSLGKEDSDDSAFSVMFTDNAGHLFWHILDVLKGDVYAQSQRIRERVVEYQIPGITIKTSGIGGFLPAILRKEFKEHGIQCGVTEEVEKVRKADRILSAYETPLSGRFLHAHRSILESGLFEQMRDWQPIKANQPDDLLDAGSGCILNMPVRIGKAVKALDPVPYRDWRPGQGSFEVSTDFD
ncbi:MAG: phage terminase large subunit [Deltaproteobacteria bacterium]